jgi:hypothetical protein
MLRSHFVLDRRAKLSYIIAQIGSDEGRARGVRSVGNRHGPAVGLASLLAGGPWCLRAAKSKRLKVPCATSSSALPSHHHHRAGLPLAPPSNTDEARSASCGPQGAGSMEQAL